MDKEVMGQFMEAHDDHDRYLKLLENATSYTDCPEVDRNVFSCLLTSKVLLKDVNKGYGSKKPKVIKDSATGEVIKLKDRTVFYQEEYVDNDRYLKLYTDGFAKFFDLSHSAYKVFGYFCQELQKNMNTDIIHFSMADCMAYGGYKTHPMIYRALTELILKEFICKSSKYKFAFYVNPVNVCNGKRSRFILDIINKDSVEELGDDKSTTEIENW